MKYVEFNLCNSLVKWVSLLPSGTSSNAVSNSNQIGTDLDQRQHVNTKVSSVPGRASEGFLLFCYEGI